MNSAAETDIDETNTDKLKVIYLLYLAGVFGGFTAFIGLPMVYIYRWKAPDWQYSHYILLEHTFWKGLVIFTLGAILKVVGIGYLVWVYLLIWWLKRCLRGFKALARREEADNPYTWFF